MKIRRVAALVSAVVLAFGMVSAVSATPSHHTSNQIHATWDCGEDGKPSCEPSQEPSEQPNCNTEQQDQACASVEPSQDASTEPSDAEVDALTSAPTLPPTDSLSGGRTNGPDNTLPIVLVVLGMIGLSAVVLIPVRAKR